MTVIWYNFQIKPKIVEKRRHANVKCKSINEVNCEYILLMWQKDLRITKGIKHAMWYHCAAINEKAEKICNIESQHYVFLTLKNSKFMFNWERLSNHFWLFFFDLTPNSKEFNSIIKKYLLFCYNYIPHSWFWLETCLLLTLWCT